MNRIVVSHAQRGRYTAHPSLDLLPMGGAAVFQPDGQGGYPLLAMLRPDEWRLLGIAEP